MSIDKSILDIEDRGDASSHQKNDIAESLHITETESENLVSFALRIGEMRYPHNEEWLASLRNIGESNLAGEFQRSA